MSKKHLFILALILIDIALFLIIYSAFPLRIQLGGGVIATPRANPGHILRLFSAVILISTGVYMAVNAFYRWPSDSKAE